MTRLGRATVGALVSLGVVTGPPVGAQARPIRGFTKGSAAQELELEARLASAIERDSVRAHFRYFTAVPHPAGSDRNKHLAEWVAERWRAYGWEDVTLHRYDVLLPWPEQVSVRMLGPRPYQATLKEDPIPADSDSYADPGPTYLGMSASGDVTAPLIYANSGNPDDYEWLKAHGVEPAGTIALVRYSNPYSYRGFKARTAQRYGVKAMLIYSDPAEDGYRRGLTFPDGPWGPESHIQRGAITYDYLVAGDPLTPGWASVDGARRIPESEAVSIPEVIAVPLSYRDARPLLESLSGPVAPAAWQGALPFTYRVGAGPATVNVVVKMDGRTRSIWNVEARIRGSEEPDQLVVLGNHRDAWVYGAVDPSSGSATELELARALGKLAREGHRPKRTIVLNSWDAEEWHLTGSTEWGEQFADQLDRGAVAYLNVDASTSGPNFGVSAVASLNPLIVETARDVTDPSSGTSLLAAWARSEWGVGSSPRTDSVRLVVNRLGSGSDYTVFLNFLGIPIADLSFGGPYGVYHSIYDSYAWMARYGDPGFRYMTSMTEVWGRMALRLANADALPYDFRGSADRVGQFVDELGQLPDVRGKLDLAPTRAAVRRLATAARELDRTSRARLAAEQTDALRHQNWAALQVEREWKLPNGIPGRPWFKHAIHAPKFTYAALELPGVREAAERGDWSGAREQLIRLGERLDAVAQAVRRATAAPAPATKR